MTAVAKALEGRQKRFANSSNQVRELIDRVAAEYAEMPGLSLTLPQAERLWSIDSVTCRAVFGALMRGNIVRRNPRGKYVRV